jgi:S-adenosylmethionine:tRNA ribosyltransferase-isomerase
MIAATHARAFREQARMLVIDRKRNQFSDSVITDLPQALRSGDLLVVNDAATLPASLEAKSPSGGSIEIRLVGQIGESDWKAVLMGEGSWEIPTELRDLPEPMSVGTHLKIAREFSAEILEVAAESCRLVTLRFSKRGSAMWSGIYAYGRPIQYSYLSEDLPLWSVQTVYASRPWAAEMPSAGYPLTWKTLLEIKRRGIRLARLTHAAGLSSAGDETIDSLLPFPEHFEIPPETIEAVGLARRSGGRVIAIGTTVVRALEGSHDLNGCLEAGEGYTDLVLNRSFQRRVVDGILTGMHDPAQSHFRLLRAFADESLLRRSWRHAAAAGYLCHEFGDVCLIV